MMVRPFGIIGAPRIWPRTSPWASGASGRIAVLEGRDGAFVPKWSMLPGDGDATVRISHAAGTPLLTWINRTSYTDIADETAYASTATGGAVHRLHADHVPLSVLGDSEHGWVLAGEDRTYAQYRLYEKTETWRECESDVLQERIGNARLWRFPDGDYLVGKPLDEEVMVKMVRLDAVCG